MIIPDMGKSLQSFGRDYRDDATIHIFALLMDDFIPGELALIIPERFGFAAYPLGSDVDGPLIVGAVTNGGSAGMRCWIQVGGEAKYVRFQARIGQSLIFKENMITAEDEVGDGVLVGKVTAQDSSYSTVFLLPKEYHYEP